MFGEKIARCAVRAMGLVWVLFLVNATGFGACQQDSDCPAIEGLIAKCRDSGTDFSSCVYYEAQSIDALVVTDQNCPFCSIKATEDFLKDNFLGIQFKAIDYRSKAGRELIEQYRVETLPFFLLGSAIKDEKNFEKLKGFVREEGDNILVNENLAGIFLFLERKKISNRIDLFLDLYDQRSKDVYNDLVKFCRENKIKLFTHFITPAERKGYPQEEVKAALAVQELYPEKAPDYVNWRIENINNLSWVNALSIFGLEYQKIKKLMDSQQMEKLLQENSALGEELTIRVGNVILVNNHRIFRVFAVDDTGLKSFFKKGGK